MVELFIKLVCCTIALKIVITDQSTDLWEHSITGNQCRDTRKLYIAYNIVIMVT